MKLAVNKSPRRTYWGVNMDHYCPYCASCGVDFLHSVVLRIPAHSSPSPTQLCKAALHGGPARGGRQNRASPNDNSGRYQAPTRSWRNISPAVTLCCNISTVKLLLSAITTYGVEKEEKKIWCCFWVQSFFFVFFFSPVASLYNMEKNKLPEY